MNQLLTPKETIKAQWSAVIAQGGKVQRRVLRFFTPHCVALGLGPFGVTNAALTAIVAALPGDAAKHYFKQPDAENRYAANTLVRAFADIAQRAGLDLPKLHGFGPKAAFEARFAVELADLFDAYRLPAVHATQARRAAILAKVGDLISPQNRAAIVNGLFNAYVVVASATGAPERLSALCDPALRSILEPAAKADTPGRAVQMLRSLAQLARSHEYYAAAASYNMLATQIEDDHDRGVISADLVTSFQPFAEIRIYHDFGAWLVAKATFAHWRELNDPATLARVGAALAALVAVSAPAKFHIIEACSFSGPVDQDRARRRPSLFSPKHGDAEAPLTPALRDCIDALYFGFVKAFGSAPLSLAPGADGLPRAGLAGEVTDLLREMGVSFTAGALRDLGVFRMAWAGDADGNMADAARLSEKHFKRFFKPMLDDIREHRKGPHGGH